MKAFSELNLRHELLEGLKQMNFQNMTEVQEKAIPVALQGKDLVVRSKTGSGKTVAFLVPIINMVDSGQRTQAIVIVPTRELAVQVNSVAQKIEGRSRIRSVVVYGGASINAQMSELSRGAEIVIGTPGRILDLLDRGALRLDRIRFFVLDEADLMLDMGFIDDIKQIMSMAPRDRQTILLSATMPRPISEISRNYMKHDTVKLTIGEEEDLTVSTISHGYFLASGRMKFAALLAYIEKFNPKKCIIFTSTQRESELVHNFLMQNKHDAILMHGGLSQAMRSRALYAFKSHSRFLISTNLASRGLDIPDITDIVNFDAPDDPHIYVHRVGRSARMGKDGRAFTMFRPDQRGLMKDIQMIANVDIVPLELDTSKYGDIKVPFTERHNRYGDRDRHGGGGRRDFGNRRDFGGRRRDSYHGGGGGGGGGRDYGSGRLEFHPRNHRRSNRQ
ncbi:MAG: DEAD/DEAH box helicase [Candidatus Micrarchaeota archaeon]|nr:DEAD/DEAH box helicase [Candidatus Micrarchaeota archaeon]